MSDDDKTTKRIADLEQRLASANAEIMRLAILAAGFDRDVASIAAPQFAARVPFDSATQNVDQDKLTATVAKIVQDELPAKFRGPAIDPEYDAAAVGKALGEQQRKDAANNLAFR